MREYESLFSTIPWYGHEWAVFLNTPVFTFTCILIGLINSNKKSSNLVQAKVVTFSSSRIAQLLFYDDSVKNQNLAVSTIFVILVLHMFCICIVDLCIIIRHWIYMQMHIIPASTNDMESRL